MSPVSKYISLCLLLWCQTSWAQQAISLSQWVERQAGPQLVKQLSRHPKFKGESLRFGAASNHRPTATPNQLVDDLSRELIHQVLASGSNDIAASNHATCQPTQDTDYFIGIEVSALGRHQHRAQIQAFDVASQRWVSGVSFAWQGRLTRNETAALQRTLRDVPPGTAAQPLTSAKDPRLSSALAHLFDCAQIHRLAGTIGTPNTDQDVDSDSQVLLDAASKHLRNDTAALIDESDSSDWQLNISQSRDGNVERFNLSLQHRQGRAAKTLGTLHVYAPRNIVVTPPKPTPQPVTQPHQPRLPAAKYSAPALGNLLTRVRPSRARDCRDCVGFELKEPAYSLVFSTVGDRIMIQSCDQPVRWREAEPLQFRVRERQRSNFPNRPSYGFYALASYRADLLEEIASLLIAQTSQCSTGASADVHTLLNVIEQAGEQIDWQAYHARQPMRLARGG